MATYINHLELSSVEENGDVNVLYPVNTGEDVTIKRDNSNLPSGVTNLQQLIDKMGPATFSNAETIVYAGETLGTTNNPSLSEINDNITKNSLTWSSNKIKNYVDTACYKFINVQDSDENYVNLYFTDKPQVMCVNTAGFTQNSCPDGLRGNFIVEYFPLIENDHTSRVFYALQRWTYLNPDSFAVYQRVYINGMWNAFKKTT